MKIFEKKQNTIMLRYQISIYEIFYKKDIYLQFLWEVSHSKAYSKMSKHYTKIAQ